jgi:hypothetical protein
MEGYPEFPITFPNKNSNFLPLFKKNSDRISLSIGIRNEGGISEFHGWNSLFRLVNSKIQSGISETRPLGASISLPVLAWNDKWELIGIEYLKRNHNSVIANSNE